MIKILLIGFVLFANIVRALEIHSTCGQLKLVGNEIKFIDYKTPQFVELPVLFQLSISEFMAKLGEDSNASFISKISAGIFVNIEFLKNPARKIVAGEMFGTPILTRGDALEIVLDLEKTDSGTDCIPVGGPGVGKANKNELDVRGTKEDRS